MDKGKVQNPLTIIAIFAGIAEVTGTTVLLGLPLEIQRIFIWFAMVFPVLLVIAFFIVLYFKRDALYAPSDFINEEYFIKLIELKKYKQQKDVNDAKEIIKEVQKLTDPISLKSEDLEITSALKDKLEKMEEKLEEMLKETNDYNLQVRLIDINSNEYSYKKVMKSQTDRQDRILSIIKKHPEGLTKEELRKISDEKMFLNLTLEILIMENKIKIQEEKYYENKKFN